MVLRSFETKTWLLFPGMFSTEPLMVEVIDGTWLKRRGLVRHKNGPVSLYYKMAFKPEMEAGWFLIPHHLVLKNTTSQSHSKPCFPCLKISLSLSSKASLLSISLYFSTEHNNTSTPNNFMGTLYDI